MIQRHVISCTCPNRVVEKGVQNHYKEDNQGLHCACDLQNYLTQIIQCR